jgi:hypothetical protein
LNIRKSAPFVQRFFGPLTGDNLIDLLTGRTQVQWHGCKLHRGAALQKQHRIVV